MNESEISWIKGGLFGTAFGVVALLILMLFLYFSDRQIITQKVENLSAVIDEALPAVIKKDNESNETKLAALVEFRLRSEERDIELIKRTAYWQAIIEENRDSIMLQTNNLLGRLKEFTAEMDRERAQRSTHVDRLIETLKGKENENE